MRVFFAIEFEQRVKEYLQEIQQQAKKHCQGGNFTRVDNFHLTLRFMGEQSKEQIANLIRVLEDTSKVNKPFSLSLQNIGRFERGNKCILWAGISRSTALSQLYSSLSQKVCSIGYQNEDRPYSPHITLARETRIEDFQRMAENLNQKPVQFEVNSVSLMESARVDNMLRYLPVAVAPLRE